MQLSYAQPIQSSISFIRGVHAGHRLRARGRFEPLLQRRRIAEVRLLSEREDSYADSQQLFAALIKAGAIRQLTTTPPRLALATAEPTLDSFFTAAIVNAEPKSATFFHEQLQDSDFVNFIDTHCRNIPDWPLAAARLASCLRPQEAARGLADLGVLVQVDEGVYRMAFKPSGIITTAPAGLYSARRGQVVGLTRSQFISHLLNHDWFYNVMAFRVIDAYGQERISAAEVPHSLLAFIRRYLE